MSLALRAPAKTNLFLEVVRRRPDGYHELDTVFAELELADTLQVAPDPAGGVALEVAGGGGRVPADRSNLVWRAVEALQAEAARRGLPAGGARLALTKRIPAGGGLGGGSADAAAALLALDRLWGLGLGPAGLAPLAAGLGSDVAFFLRGGLQRGRGRGELLEPLPPLAQPLELTLVLPDFPCPTPEVYRALAPFLPAVPRAAEPVLAALASGDPAGVAREVFNRLEQPAFARFPALASLEADLARRPGVLAALLSGSGSTLVCLCAGRDEAEALAAALTAEGLQAVATRTAAPR